MRSGSNSARHWLLGNVPGHVLKAGFSNENTTAGVDIMQPFHGPHPPAPGTPGRTDYIHVYGQFAWKQPTPTIKFAPMDPDRHSCALPHTPSYPLPRRSGRICTAHLSTRALAIHWPLASGRDTISLVYAMELYPCVAGNYEAFIAQYKLGAKPVASNYLLCSS